jgi:hypothetical protein
MGRIAPHCAGEGQVRHIKPYSIIPLLALLAFASCSRQAVRDSHQTFTEDDVRKFVQPGTPIASIVQKFGEPIHDEKNPKFADGSTNIDEIVYFNLPPPPGTKGNWVFCGFSVRLKAGMAVDWSSTHEN